MALVDVKQKVIHCKIVYYGPGISGKTSTLQYIHAQLPPEDRGDLLSIATETERNLFFDCQMSEAPLLRGFRLRWHLYTIPGAVLYERSKRAVLAGADGIVFVAESRSVRLAENRKSLRELADFLRAQNKTLQSFPIVLQYHKRDLPDILTVEALNTYLNPLQWKHFEANTAFRWHDPTRSRPGEGVMETFQAIRTLVIDALQASKDVAEKLRQQP